MGVVRRPRVGQGPPPREAALFIGGIWGVVVTIAGWVPARHATAVDPADTLKTRCLPAGAVSDCGTILEIQPVAGGPRQLD